MSVINQMLKDLEQRQGQASPATRLVESLGVRTERIAANKTTIWWLVFTASMILLAASFLLSKGNSNYVVSTVPGMIIAPADKPVGSPVNTPVASESLQVAAAESVKQEKLPEPVVELSKATVQPSTPPSESITGLSTAPIDTASPDTVSTALRSASSAASPVAVSRSASSPSEASVSNASKAKSVAPEEEPEAVTSVNDIKRPAGTAQLAESRYQRALEYLQVSRMDPAIEQLREAVRLQPDMHVARELLANLYLRTGRNAEAFIVLKAGMDASPQYLPFAKMYARTLVQQGQLPAAKQVLESSLLFAGNDADYQALLAAVEQRLGDHGAAVSRYMRALEINKQQGTWWVGMGISLEALGRNAEANQAYKAARVSPGLSAELVAYVESRLKQLGS